MLIGMAVTGYRGFDFSGSVAMNFDAVLGGSEQDDATDFGEAQSGLKIERGKNRFQGENTWRKFIDEPANQFMNSEQRGFRGLRFALASDLQGAVFQHAAVAAVAFDNAVTRGTRGSGIHAKDANAAGRERHFLHGNQSTKNATSRQSFCYVLLRDSETKSIRADGGLDFTFVDIEVSVNVLDVVVFL